MLDARIQEVKMIPRRRGAFIAIAVLIAVIGALGGYKYWRVSTAIAQAAAYPEPAEAVEAAQAREIVWQPSASAAGTVVAKRFVRLSNTLAGPVESVAFESGQLVKEGQVLLRLDTGRERAELKSALADIDFARITLERMERLVETRAISQSELDRSRAQLEQAQARAAVLREQIEDRMIRAPFAGRVGLRDVHPGQFLAEGTELTTIESVSTDVDVDFRLAQEIAAQLAVGGEITLSGGALERPTAARIIAIDARADEASRNVRVRAEAKGLGTILKPGAFVDVQVASAAPRKVLAVPLSAVRRAAYGDHVYVIGDPKPKENGSRVAQRFVRTGPVVGKDIVVLEGLERGDRVATTGAFKLNDGSLVSVTQPTTQSDDAKGVAANTPLPEPDVRNRS
jgi:membrane fusion protein, multidrug efflux system